MERNPMEEASKDIFILLHHNNQLLSKKEVSEQYHWREIVTLEFFVADG